MRTYANNLAAFLLAAFLLIPAYGLSVSVGSSNQSIISEIISVNEEETESGTTITISGNGTIGKHETETYDSPPMIIIDLIAPAKLIKTKTIQLKTDLIKQVRIGCHEEKIRIVFDIQGHMLPKFNTKIIDNDLTVSLEKTTHEKEDLEIDIEPTKTIKAELKADIWTVSNNDGQGADAVLFRKAVHAYKEKKWETSEDYLNELIKAFPKGKYVENASFLLAKAHDKLHPNPAQNHFNDIKDHYNSAIRKFPESIFVPDAILSIGDLYFKAEIFNKAIEFYNLILNKHKDSDASPKALLKIAEIMELENRHKDAISGINYIIRNYQGIPEETEAKIIMAKIAYKENSFHKSINILTKLIEKTPENLYRYPEISLYLGYNYFQLGESAKARTDLLRYYNSCPEKNSHLILTKVGDTYLDEGEIGNAVKFYYLVLKRYPQSEGAIISKIRLAEQQEKGNVGGNIPEKIASPKKIYEEILDNFRENSLGHPFEELAMLRLAKIYEDNEDYNKSLGYLKSFLKKYPRSSLKEEARHSFNNVIGKILNIELKAGRYYNILDIYETEKNAILKADSAYPYLPIARAFMHLSFDDMSANIFKMADKLLPEMEKPSDLLYSLSMDSFKKNNYEEALSYVNALIKNHPDNSLTPYAYKLKGKIFFKQGKYSLAEDFFKLALKFNLNPYEKLLHSIRNDNILKFGCRSFYSQIYQDIGDLNLHVGHTKNALGAFKQALDFEESEENKTLLLIKIAKCYKLLNKKDEYLPIYEQIAALENVWSNIAKYEIEGIDFNDKIIKKGIE